VNEIWNLYTKDRKKTDLLHTRGNPIPSGYYHIVVEIWTIINNKILITQRHKNKQYGLLWECTGGSIIENENSIDGAQRELKEEIGLNVSEENMNYIFSYDSKDTFYDVYVNYQSINCINEIKLQEEEVVNFKLVSREEFNCLLRNGEIITKLGYINKIIDEGKIRLTTAST
jgi:8-oxo-dGTP pyrophosphatase MutT (NUDIX family)